MENFQLYKTNLLLGGQLKWDVVLENDSNKLYVKDFNITPISDNIPYTYKYNEDILNNSHHENIKIFYKNIEGHFYDEGLDTIFCNNWPTIVSKGEYAKVYSNIYDMGCKRVKNYKRYNKQFEFFCPLWLEKVSDSISFIITVKGKGSESILASHTIDILKNDGHYKHDKFVKYVKNHLKYTGIDKGSNKVIKIKFNDQSYVTGINAKTGLKCIKNISSIVANMTTRERPVMEVDNMIMNCFSNHNIICNQLFNFNICFNIDDIMSSTTAKLIKGKPLTISIDVKIDGVEIEKRDFSCNYDFIEKEKYYDETKNMGEIKLDNLKTEYPNIFEKYNVLDHLHDNEYIGFIDKNKYCQKICHWSLADNPTYMFNLYRGFDGYSITLDDDIPVLAENEHQYGSTPNISSMKHSLSLNNAGWINVDDIKYWNQFYNYMLNTDKYKNITPTRLEGQKYINGLKYNYIPDDLYIVGIKTNSNIFTAISNTYIKEIDWLDKSLGVLIKDDLIMLITYNWDYLTFAKVFDILFNLNKNNWIYNDEIVLREKYLPIIIKIFYMMQSAETPELIMLDGSLAWKYASGPANSNNISEISYVKNEMTDYVFRYDGNIKPFFINKHDIIYYKDYLSDNRDNGLSNLQKSIYAKYANTGYEPVYPSIQYSACKKLTEYDRTILPEVNITEYGNIPIIKSCEYSWYNNGVSMFVLPEITFKYENKRQPDGSYKELKDIVKELLKNYYIIDNEELDYIVSLYKIENNWEYLSDTNVDDYLYTIKLSLK